VLKNTSSRLNRRALARALAFVAVVLAVGIGAYAFGRSQSPAGLEEMDRQSLELYAEALDVVRDDYVDQEAIDPRQQTYAAIEGMLDSLGDEGHTRFLTPEEREQNRAGLSGTYVGVGIQLEDEDDRVVVAAPIEGSPAEQAGIQTGDIIVAVNGESVRGTEMARIAERVRGPEGTTVELTILRDGEEREFTLERAEIKSPVVSWSLVPGTEVAHVRLASFTDDSAGKLEEAFSEARDAGAERFILDLRNNSGGKLNQAVRMAGQFLEPGSVVYLRENASGERDRVEVSRRADPTDAPLVVLVNNGSASSAEILAGALRDNDRATVVGTRTFGTGTVLQEFTLDDGSSILLGIAEWLTPGGDFIRESGIEPDIKAELGDEAELLTPGEVEDLTREEAFEQDSQLRRAFEEVRDQ
jgi:carboxyl-terminal processing protease